MTDGSDSGGGFRWNLKPGGGEEPPAPAPAAPPSAPAAVVAPIVSAESATPRATVPDNRAADAPDGSAASEPDEAAAPKPDESAASTPGNASASAPDNAVASAPDNNWDVPTAASPVIARSVFPLPPPAGAPALLPPPYVPPPLIPPPSVPPLDSSLPGATEVLGARPFGLPDPVNEGPETTVPGTSDFGTSDIDVLFGDAKFVDYSTPAVPADPPTTAMPPQYLPPPMARPPLPLSTATELPATTVLFAGSLAAGAASASSLPPQPASALALYVPPKPVSPGPVAAHAMPRQQKILLGVAGGLVALLALVALFLLGTRIGAPTSAPEAAITPAVPSASTPTVAPVTGTGPVAAGDHPFDELLGGECLTLYESPWQENYTVVDCGQPHPAQMLVRATLPDAAGAAYPATADLQASTTLACTAATVIDYASAEEFDDIEISVSFPPNSERWAAGDRTYYCFASRSGGGDLTGSIAIPAD
jgi:Septum formation